MKISAKGRYALRLMIELAKIKQNEYISLKELTTRTDISLKYAEQIVSALSKNKLIESLRGVNGGYRLSKKAFEYSAGEIIRAIEGPIAPITCLETPVNECEYYNSCSTIRFWEGLMNVINEYSEGFLLSDFCGSNDTE